MLLRHLPMDSWTQTALRDEKFRELVDPDEQKKPEKFGPWRLDNYQLAALTDAVNHLSYLTGLIGQLQPKPEPSPPTPRPGLNRPVRRQSEAAVLYLDSLRARG